MSESRSSAVRAAVIAVVSSLAVGVAVILAVPRLLGFLTAHTSPAGGEAAIQILLSGLLMTIALAAGRWQRLRIWRIGERPGTMIPAGLGLGIAGVLTAAALAWLAGSIGRGTGIGGTATAFVLGTATIVIQVAGEESFVRGWLQPLLQRAIGNAGGVAASALIFTILHLIVGTRAPLTLLNLFLAGGVFGLLAWRTGGLVAPMAMHFGWNWVEQQWVGLDPNPGIGPFGSIFNFDLMGAAAWGGSIEGLNASVATTFVLCALCLPLVPWRSVASPIIKP